jgi:hypothetical protein
MFIAEGTALCGSTETAKDGFPAGRAGCVFREIGTGAQKRKQNIESESGTSPERIGDESLTHADSRSVHGYI